MRDREHNLLTCVTIVLLLLSTAAVCSGQETDRIRPSRQNPNYWQYEGEPVLLAGGTKDDSLFQIPDLEKHLDLLAKVGGNYIRNTMSDRQDHGFEVYPFKRLENGKYDLDRWNDEYWDRFRRMLELTRERDVIVQIEVWDRFDYSQEQWEAHPYRPVNNVNYTTESSGLKNHYPAPAWRDKQPFFHSIPGMERYREKYDTFRRYQERFVDRVASISLDYDNVLYCMDNETCTPPPWGQYWMKFIQKRAKQRDLTAHVTDMFDHGWKPRSCWKCKVSFEKTDLYRFIDISQVNSRTFNEDHWENILWVVRQVRKQKPRPVNHVKIYGSGHLSFGTGGPKDGLERFWRNLIAGSAAVRFHRDGAGNGLKPIAQASIRAVRKVEQQVKFWDVQPHMGLLGSREEDEAYLAADPGKQYVLYFTDGGSVTLDLRKHNGQFELQWIDIGTGEWGPEDTVRGGEKVKIQAPGKGDRVVTIVR